MNRRGKLYQWFAYPWRVVPAQAVLFTFLFIAGVHVVATPNNTSIGFELAGLSTGTYHWWNALILTSPMLVGIAYVLIRFGQGYCRLVGFWLRLGGDLGMVSALTVIITTRVAVLSADGVGDSPLFAMIALAGVTTWCVMLVARDVGAIVTLEQLASKIHSATKQEP